MQILPLDMKQHSSINLYLLKSFNILAKIDAGEPLGHLVDGPRSNILLRSFTGFHFIILKANNFIVAQKWNILLFVAGLFRE